MFQEDGEHIIVISFQNKPWRCLVQNPARTPTRCENWHRFHLSVRTACSFSRAAAPLFHFGRFFLTSFSLYRSWQPGRTARRRVPTAHLNTRHLFFGAESGRHLVWFGSETVVSQDVYFFVDKSYVSSSSLFFLFQRSV